MQSSISKEHFEFPFDDRSNDDVARFVADEEGRIIFASPRMCELAGAQDYERLQGSISSEDGQSLIDCVGGEEFLDVNGQLISFQLNWVVNSQGRKMLVASELEDHDYEDRSVFSISKLNDADSKSGRSLGSLKRDTDPLQFINMSNDIMIVSDADGRILRVNNTFYDVLGYSKEDLDSLPLINLFEEDDKSRARTFIQTLTVHDENPDIIDFEARVLSKDGQLFWVDWRQRYHDEFLYSVGRDVTAIKLHEHELCKREDQLLEAEILGRMGHWRWLIGKDYIEWSDQIFRIFGLKKGEFVPSIDSLNQTIHKRDFGRVVQAFQRAIIEQNDYDMEFRIIRSGGDIRYIRCEGRCERDADGDVIALYGIMQDMTERMLYERELKEAKDAAERAYAAKSQFLANMSHELRTPLNAVIGFSEMMQRQLLGPIGTEKYLDYIAGIRESGEHLLDLISDILVMSKIEAGKHELDLEEVNVIKVIKLAAHMMEGRALEAGVKIDCSSLNDENIVISADRRAFMQVMLNLLSNAVKFSEEEGQVWVECAEHKESVSIKVIDNGIGIPANKLSSITNPFEQASSSYSRNHEGSGLGLAITKELVNMHGGRLSIESTVDVGTTVNVRFPYKVKTKRV